MLKTGFDYWDIPTPAAAIERLECPTTNFIMRDYDPDLCDFIWLYQRFEEVGTEFTDEHADEYHYGTDDALVTAMSRDVNNYILGCAILKDALLSICPNAEEMYDIRLWTEQSMSELPYLHAKRRDGKGNITVDKCGKCISIVIRINTSDNTSGQTLGYVLESQGKITHIIRAVGREEGIMVNKSVDSKIIFLTETAHEKFGHQKRTLNKEYILHGRDVI